MGRVGCSLEYSPNPIRHKMGGYLVLPHKSNFFPMRFEGTLTTWNDDRGFGYLESTQGGEPIFVHVSCWPRYSSRPQLNQAVSFEVEIGPKGKRARNVQLIQSRRLPRQSARANRAQWGTATLFALPAFLVVYLVVTILWKPPIWIAAWYIVASAVTFATYAADKFAAGSGARRTPESTLHLLSFAGGWPGALLAQQFLRHKSTKHEFRQFFWATVVLNLMALVVLASPLGRRLLAL